MLARIGTKKPKIFGVMDLTAGYHQGPLKPECAWLTAFITFMGLYEFNRVPMGLKGAGPYFQMVMATIVLVGLLYVICELYLDDILIYAATNEEFLASLRKVFERCRQYNITVNPDKCKFGLAEVEYVGHTINKEGIKFTQEKILACLAIPKPQRVEKLQTFLGLANYFRDHIANHSRMAQPLHQLIPKGATGKHPVQWNEPAEEGFNQLLSAIEKCPTLYFLKNNAEVFLHTDASDNGIGAYLFQKQGKNTYPVAFVSKSLNPTQLRWSTHEKEGYAIYYTLTKLEYLLQGIHFTMMTDHANLVYINTEGSPKVKRWKLAIQEFDFSVYHIPGKDNVVADAFSRLGDRQPVEGSVESLATTWLNALTVADAIAKTAHGDEQWLSRLPTAPYNREEEEKVHNAFSGHSGVESTCERLKQTGLNREHMREHVKYFIKKCPLCQKMTYLKPPIQVLL